MLVRGQGGAGHLFGAAAAPQNMHARASARAPPCRAPHLTTTIAGTNSYPGLEDGLCTDIGHSYAACKPAEHATSVMTWLPGTVIGLVLLAFVASTIEQFAQQHAADQMLAKSVADHKKKRS